MTAALNITACAPDRQEYEEQACRLLEEKYGEEFEVYDYLGSDHIKNSYKITAFSREYPEILFEAEAAEDGSSLSDQYVASRVCRKIEEQVSGNIAALPGYFQIKVQAVSMSIDSADADMSPEEFASLKTNNQFGIYLHYCPVQEEWEKTWQVIEKAVYGMEYLRGSIFLYIVEEDTLKKIQNYLDENAELYYEYDQIVENVSEIPIPFENGVVQMSENEFLEMAGE